MDKIAKETLRERELYFIQAATQLNLAPSIIEKDFWVCWTLKRLFALESVKDNLLFKGGTSLSKVYNLIRRFSEDIDLSIHRESLGFGGDEDPAALDISNKERKRRLVFLAEAAREKIFNEIRPELAESIRFHLGSDGWTLNPDPTDKDEQSLAFAYPRTGLTPEPSNYIRPAVKIEFGARSDHWPKEPKPVKPYLAEALTNVLDDPEVVIITMSARRTFWEKATILHQMAHLPDNRGFTARYSRHYYDLAVMIDAGVVDPEAFEEDELLAAVVDHKMIFFRSGWANYPTAVRGSLKLLPQDDRIPELRQDLNSMREMFFDEPPKLETVLESLRKWEAQFNQSSS